MSVLTILCLILKVNGRREKQVKQIIWGLKDTGVLLMIKERPSLITVLFPRAVDKIILPEVMDYL